MKSIGEQRVRIDFNVSGSDIIHDFKKSSAELINKLEEMREDKHLNETQYREYQRLISLAQTAYEEACMWAVKAATI